MDQRFELAGATVTGRDHRYAWKNDQDALAVREHEGCLACVVSDGCGSGRYSEAGSRLTAALLSTSLARGIDVGQAFNDLLAHLERLAGALDISSSQAVEDHLLATVVGVVISQDHATFFSLGDGLIVVNGERIALGPFPDNAPPYPAYRLPPIVWRVLPAGELESFLIGTDGLTDLTDAENKVIPGTQERVGPLENLWTNDRLFRNPDALRRHLLRLQGGLVWERQAHGLLCDDTTLVVGRRKKGGTP